MPTSPHAMYRPRYYSASDLKELLNVGPSAFEEWVAKGRLPAPVRPGGPRGKRLWPVEVIDKMLAELEGATTK